MTRAIGRYLTPEAAAARKGVGRAAVRAAIDRGDLIPVSVHVGSDGETASIGLDPKTVDAWSPKRKGRPRKVV